MYIAAMIMMTMMTKTPTASPMYITENMSKRK